MQIPDEHLKKLWNSLFSYFSWNPIKHSTVDPMHNLCLETGKHVMKVWVENGIITKKDFSKLEQGVANILTPRSVGRIPKKIGSGFSGFTTNQWKNWITIFSPVALKEILPSDHLRCWLLYRIAGNFRRD